MTNSLAPSGAPPWACLCWADATHVYIEYPSKLSSPYIQRFPLGDPGFAKAILFMRKEEKAKSLGVAYVAPAKPSPTNKKPSVGTEDQRAKARDVLKRLKLLP